MFSPQILKDARLALAPLFSILSQENPVKYVAETSTNLPKALPNHLPRTEEELAKLTIRQKVILQAGIAAGSDAVAYYDIDSKGQMSLSEHFDIIDIAGKKETSFPPTDEFKPNTFSSIKAVRDTNDTAIKENEEDERKSAHAAYHIPVVDKNGVMRGVVVIHVPTNEDGYNRLQTISEELANRNQKSGEILADAHESVAVRKSKLDLAETAVSLNSNLLLTRGDEILPQDKDAYTPSERKTFFLEYAKGMFKTFLKNEAIPASEYVEVNEAKTADELRKALRKLSKYEDNTQLSHLTGSGDLMQYTADAMVQDKMLKPEQADFLTNLAMVHDAGKLLSTAFFKHNFADINSTDQEMKNRIQEAFALNASHAFMGEVLFSLSPGSAKTVGHHHHGEQRYSDEQLLNKLGTIENVHNQVVPTEHTEEGNVSYAARMLRVGDVFESITGAGVDKPAQHALRELANKAGASYEIDKQTKLLVGKITDFKEKSMDPNTIDVDSLCYMIEKGVFEKYAVQRETDEKFAGKDGWVRKGNQLKFNAEEFAEIKQDILQKFDWENRREAAISRIKNDMLTNTLFLNDIPVDNVPLSKPASVSQIGRVF